MITKTTQYCKNQKLSKAISYVTGSEFIVEAHARETVKWNDPKKVDKN